MLLALGLPLAVALSLALGEHPLSFSRALTVPGSDDALVLYRLRLPRAVLAALVGAALAASGAALQALLRNPLADPFVLGVSGGAAVGATAALAVGAGAATFFGLSGVAVAAFAGAGLAAAAVFAAGRVGGRSSPHAVLLAGTVFNALSLSAITFLRALSSHAQADLGLLHWLAGSLTYEAPSTLVLTSVLVTASLGGLWVLSGRLNVLSLGDDEAASLGVPVEGTRLWVLACSSLAVAAVVSLAGLIGFVGLLVPHALRGWVGADLRWLLPASALGGAVMLLCADAVARLLFPVFQGEPPVGALTALLGGPLFLWLLRRGAHA